MNTPSPGMLAQRQLRAAEIALETARRRRRETDAELAEAEAEVEAAQTALAQSRAERERERAEAQEQLAQARVGRTAAEQRYVEEHSRRLALEQQLAALRREGGRRDDLTRQLAAETRIRELEGDLEIVTRHAATFEYGVRMAAFDAFKVVREMADVVSGLLSRTGLVPAPRRDVSGEPGAAVEPRPATSGLDAERLDAALERLRATTPPPTDEPPASV
jgi:septal ring factor EnvC (AmiA/AmiB activator)